MVRHWKFAVAIASLPAFAPRFTATESRMEVRVCLGDVNRDAKVDVSDAHLIARVAIGMRVPDRAGVIARGDVTGDGLVNVTDAQQVARHAIGLSVGRRLGASCRLAT